MRRIDLEGWPRRSTFEFFKDYEDPFFNLTAPVDVTALYGFCRAHNLSISLISLYYSLRAANLVPELKQRYADDGIVEFDKIHATQTILNDDDTFSFCYFEYAENPLEFDRCGKLAVEHYKSLKTFDVETDRTDLIYYSVIPWVSFTSFKHATRRDKSQTVPRMVFGKTYELNGRRFMPHSVEAHHAFVDGLHVGRYFEYLQNFLDSLPNS